LKIKVKVKQEDEERAREVLGAHEEEELPAEDRMPVTPVMERSKDPVWTVLAGLVAIFASLVWLTGFRPLGDPSPLDRLVELGALEGWPPAAEGYRLITMNFLHLDWLHLLTNIEGLILFGWAAVRLFGLGQTALVYALAALASGLSTALFLEPVVAVGASGCVFALTFMTLAGLLRLALSVTVARWRALIRVVGWALFMIPPAFYFNWAAHLSGALIGLLLGFLLPLAPMEPHTAFRNRGRVLGILGGLILAVPWLWCLILGA
jgi:membrane associated rhomboid family serine protease